MVLTALSLQVNSLALTASFTSFLFNVVKVTRTRNECKEVFVISRFHKLITINYPVMEYILQFSTNFAE